jgi:hypothetical protein
MPLFPIAYAPILTSFILILYGIFVEKWFVSYLSGVMNGIAIVVALTTLQFVPFQAILVLLGYAMLCIFISFTGSKDLVWLAGSRVTGGLLLGLGLADLGIFVQPLNVVSVLILSSALGVVSYVIGWAYSRFLG